MKSVCVFCGSSSGNSPLYKERAESLAQIFFEKQITLIYGGGSVGIMGALSTKLDTLGGKVIGVIPQALKPVSGQMIGECFVVDTMHERKQKMSELAEALIALPGGFGTMEELLEAITWSQLRIHQKPIGILNINGFFDPFIKWMDHALQEGFIDAKSRRLVVVSDDCLELVKKLEEWQDPIGEGWILSGEMWTTKHPRLKDV